MSYKTDCTKLQQECKQEFWYLPYLIMIVLLLTIIFLLVKKLGPYYDLSPKILYTMV